MTRLALLLTVLLVGCGGPQPSLTAPGSTASSPTAPRSPTVGRPSALRLMTHDSFAMSDEVRAEFEAQHNVRLEILRSGDAGRMVNQAILARAAPLADVLFGVDNTFLSRALEADIFEPYRSPGADGIPPALQLDARARVTPIDYGDVCLNFDRSAFSSDLPPPASLADLLDPRYRGMLVVQNPATSSPGLAFLLATYAQFGEITAPTPTPVPPTPVPTAGFDWRDYWSGLRANDVLVTAGWEEAYFGAFSGGSGEGDRPIVVSYATSPVAEVLGVEPAPDAAPTGVVTDGCFRQIEFAGLLRGAPPASRRGAEALIDFMLSRRFQEDLPLQMFVFPANPQASLPAVFAEHAARVTDPLTMDPAAIDGVRERLITEWTDVVLR